MPVLQEKWITSPQSVIKDLFAKRGENVAESASWGIREFFEEKLKFEKDLSSVSVEAVPSLNSDPLRYLRDGSLVRYRGMIQDQFGTELYLKTYQREGTQEMCCGMYSDLVPQPEASCDISWDSPTNVMGDRQTLYCVPIPAETEWVKDVYSKGSKVIQVLESPPPQSQLKRKMDEMEEGEEEEEEGGGTPMEEDGALEDTFKTKKRACSDEVESAAKRSHDGGHDLNFPLPAEGGTPCLVKIYDQIDECPITSVVEIVGVLSIHPSLAPLTYSNHGDQQTAAEKKVHSPPPSLVPRLHAITIKFLSHSNPLLPPTLHPPLEASIFAEYIPMEGGVATCRGVVLDMLADVLCGDRLAAEYTLLHLISSIYGRTDVLALGKFSLNLSRCSQPGVSRALHHLLTNWLTKCFSLPLSLDTMNNLRFVPKKDYSSDRLISSVLQLSSGTQVLVDETALFPGQLTQVGVANLTALGNVIQWQKLSYDFQFNNIDFECDLPILILSEGKSILKVDTHVPIVPAIPRPVPPPSAQLVDHVRRYLTLCHGLHYTLTNQMKQVLENEFVSVRSREPTSSLNADTFNHLLSTARLVCLSHASSTLTPQLWEHTRTLNKERMKRLNMI